LRTRDGQDLLHRLVRDVDVFVTNAPLASRARLRVRYEDLAPLNTRLVYASISAYGETGEEAGKPGFDSIALWARTGLMDLVRASPDVPPARSLPGMGDHPTGTALFAAIMAGLYHRERTGRGALVAIDDPRAGASLTVSSPLQIGGQEKVPPTLAPEIGQHTVEILRGAGIAAAEIDRLLQAGVIVQA